jgi:hypothetical protein
MKYFITLLLGEIIGYYVYINGIMPRDIEQRAKELNILRYDSKTDKFIIKDSVYIDNFDLEYLKYGTINKK